MYALYVGVDIAADSATIHWHNIPQAQTGSCSIQQNPAAYQHLHDSLTQHANPQQTHVVMEATGNYWLGLALFLHERAYAVSVINPAQAKHFAKMHLQRTKTDAVDARLLCDFGRTLQPRHWTPPPPIAHTLRQYLERRDDLLHMATQEQNRWYAMQHDPFLDPTLAQQVLDHIHALQQQAQSLLTAIQDLLQQHHHWQQAARRLLTIPGIGWLTAAWLLVTTQAFTLCQSPEQAAAFAGLVPHHRQSGRSLHGRSTIGGGHPQLRKTLYMAAGAALRFNPPLRTFYQHLVQRGKIKQVARIAVARKLVHIAWACVVKERDFDPHFGRLQLRTTLKT